MVVAPEAFSERLFQEILPLGRKCWAESTAAKGETCAWHGERDFEIEPDLEQYRILNNAGILKIVTLRDADSLVGYGVGILYRGLHHRKLSWCAVDSFYVEPTYRAYAIVLIAEFEKHIISWGADMIGWPTHIDGPMYQLLKAHGYTADDMMMEKRLCA